MTQLQAAMRDKSAKTWKERRTYYKIGSYFKGCRNCGVVEMVETKSGKFVERYTSGTNVFRSYDPKATKWTYACAECGAKDLKCWAPDKAGFIEETLGEPPIQGTRDAKKEVKGRIMARLKAEDPRPEAKKPQPNAEILAMQAEIARLRALLGGK